MSEGSGRVSDRPDDERKPEHVAKDIWDNRDYYEAMQSAIRVEAGQPTSRVRDESRRIKEPLQGEIRKIGAVIIGDGGAEYPNVFEVHFEVVGSTYRLEYSGAGYSVTVSRERGQVNQKAEHEVQVLEVGGDV